MTRSKFNRNAAAALLTVCLVFGFGASPARAGGSVAGLVYDACGKYVVKLRDFGKLKIKDYNLYVPENLRANPGSTDIPTFQVRFIDDVQFLMIAAYPDVVNDPLNPQNVAVLIQGDYTKKGNRLKFFPTSASLLTIGDFYAGLGENVLFGARQLVTDIPYTELRKIRFKGRIQKRGQRIKLKWKANMGYDIQFMNNSEFADIFGAKGRFKLRAKGPRQNPGDPPFINCNN